MPDIPPRRGEPPLDRHSDGAGRCLSRSSRFKAAFHDGFHEPGGLFAEAGVDPTPSIVTMHFRGPRGDRLSDIINPYSGSMRGTPVAAVGTPDIRGEQRSELIWDLAQGSLTHAQLADKYDRHPQAIAQFSVRNRGRSRSSRLAPIRHCTSDWPRSPSPIRPVASLSIRCFGTIY